ncbi:glycosyltransferase [Alicyclobacillus mengziensis]|uniref:Glycosyltransferase n=1 Tax=Alicyclobacillus mengziensis TaxID=2931921 RepID=A0A9X7Z5R8_9BACL|nr:glycosyltransferase [Alicyclobacillus mengziensis]QSO46637.1 glycosyltransferase [Alicyclobacillus mengziensis]
MSENKLRVHWEGSQLVHHSLALVNREICTRMMSDPSLDLGVIPYETDPNFPVDERLKALQSRIVPNGGSADITVRHQWPPKWTAPPTGKWVISQPWEYGAIPRQWYIPMKYWVDEIWVASSYNKECYVRCGIPQDKICVIPHGVDPSVFHPEVPAIELNTNKSFKFLFVGATIFRKGIDILLEAYASEFTSADDVCLVIKDFGMNSVYEGQTSAQQIRDFQKLQTHPEVLYITSHFSASELAGLYQSCDCLVHPYRGEGFGLPILEAMACGTPPIVPNMGSACDFCTEKTAFFVPSEEKTYPSMTKIGPYDLIDHPWWIEVDRKELRRVMRRVYENHSLVKEKGMLAAQDALTKFTWDDSVARVINRLKAIATEQHRERKTVNTVIEEELRHAVELYLSGAPSKALEIFRCVLEKDPLNVTANYNAGILYVFGNNFRQALEHFVTLTNRIDDRPDSFRGQVWSYIGLCHTQMNNYSAAMAALDTGTRLSPDSLPGAIRCYQQILRGIEQTEDAEHLLGELYHRLAIGYFTLKNELRAKDMSELALKHEPNRDDFKHTHQLIQQKISITKETYEKVLAGTSHHRYGLIWRSPVFNGSGYAEESKSFLMALQQHPVEIHLVPIDGVPNTELTPSSERTLLTNMLTPLSQQPIIHLQSCPAYQFELPRAPISIGRTMYETDSVPETWVERMNEQTEIWVPSHFNRDTFIQAGVDANRIYVMPGALDLAKYSPETVEPYALDTKKSFRFLSVFDWSLRKGWDVLLRSYFSEFRADEDVCLVLKVVSLLDPNARPREEIQNLTQKMGIPHVPEVLILDNALTEEEMIQLYKAADAFVLPSRGEGWGRPYMEAMAMQLPTIGTRWSGQTEFMSDENSYLIDIDDVVPVSEKMPYYEALFKGHNWAEPSESHLKSLMRYVFEQRNSARQVGVKARESLMLSFSRDKIGSLLFNRLEELVRRHYT